ncbi:hypothetical protein K1X12_11975 [Hyphomonas sp. WL0036]|uniref:hypothetical protein n=1 Tax=Hyphomonas sediminis TaxID=2866160 RepID=UPI001C80965E|nr:hypothetical protein [Hyphomonas sediminis]MBY9067620.1 hypothetical protein [Hyphomonas sediminis]
MSFRRQKWGKARNPKTVEYASYLARCSEDTAVAWLQTHRHLSTQDLITERHLRWNFDDQPEWDQLLDGVLYLRRSKAINSALARYGTRPMCQLLLKRHPTKSDTINLAANPFGPHWDLIDSSHDKDVLRAVIQNPALSLEAMGVTLDAKRIGFGGDRKQRGLTPDEIALRLFFLGGNERFIGAARGAPQKEDSSPEYIGFPWADLKKRLGELIMELPIQANTCVALSEALQHFGAGLHNQIKLDDPIAAIERWRFDPPTGSVIGELGSFMGQEAFSSTVMTVIASAAIPGTKEWMHTEHHEAFGGFCHNVRALGSYEGIYPEDLLTEQFEERVKAWKAKETEGHSSMRGSPNPLWSNEHMWMTRERRRVVRHYTDWYGDYESHRILDQRLAYLLEKYPHAEREPVENEHVEAQPEHSLLGLRQDLGILYQRVNEIQRSQIPNWLALLGFLVLGGLTAVLAIAF